MNQTRTPPRLLNWTGYLAITFLLILPLSVLTVRAGAWQQGLGLYALACLGSALLLLIFVLLLLLPRYAPWRGGIGLRILAVIPGTLLVMALVGNGGDYPPIHDITTDTQNPPTFTQAKDLRGEGANPLDIDPDTIAQQRASYPSINTVQSELSIDEAFTRAVTVAETMGWEIYHQDRNAGVIEAVETTQIMAFKDDVVIRVRGNASGAIVDLRSVSRVGLSDLGANAKRIQAFFAAFGGAEGA